MKCSSSGKKCGFTLVELMVVILIMSLMMALGGSVLRGVGKGRSMDSGVEALENLLREAQATAMGNDTYARVVVGFKKEDTSNRSPHLRYLTVQMYRKDKGSDSTEVAPKGRWVSTSAGMTLPSGVFFSPHYSKPLGGGSSSELLGQDNISMGGKGQLRVFYILFDEKGRFVGPKASPQNETKPLRLVLINGRFDNSRRANDGIRPLETDGQKRPVGAKGVIVWPHGDISRLRTQEQVFGN